MVDRPAAFITAQLFPAAFTVDLEVGAGSFDGELPFHFSQACHDVEEAAGRSAGLGGVGKTFELHADHLYEMLDTALRELTYCPFSDESPALIGCSLFFKHSEASRANFAS